MNTKNENFCQAYVACGNASKAAIKAGYSEKTSASAGSRLLTKSDVKARVAELSKEANKRAGLDQDLIRKFWLDTLTDEEAKTSDKVAVARDAGKHLDMFVEKVEAKVEADCNFTMVVHGLKKD